MTNPLACNAGSLWRRWDLHLHTPGTKLSNGFGDRNDDGVWNEYIDQLESSLVQAFGVTDYFSCDTYFELIERYKARKPDSTKVFFPNIELRLAESISADGSHPHIHVIFDNDPATCGKDKLARFLSDLHTQSIDDENAKGRCCDLKSEADFAAATVTLDDLLKALAETFGDARPYLLAFPANNDGLRSTDSGSPRKVALADRIDRSCQLFLGNQKNTSWFLRTDRYASGESEPKPVVSGSDAHTFDDLERLSGDVSGFPGTWIKADTTFIGLKQITYEPEGRIHIGSQPTVLTRQEQDGTKFLKTLTIDHVEGYDGRNGQWFKSVDLPLNPELTTIIGNKGSGKSAIVDIVGLLGDSRQEAHFSFLIDDSKRKKFRQRGYAENFEASVTWHTDRVVEKRLSDNCDLNEPETVRYLPQNYFEQLTNEIEIEQFRHEIEDVVFSHVDETDKLGKSTFAELEETKTLQSKQEISEYKARLREANVDIVRLEEQSSPQFQKQLESQIAAKKRELEALDKAKPKEVPRPDTETPEQKELTGEIDRLTKLLSNLQTRGEERVSELSALKVALQDAASLKESLSNIGTNLQRDIADLADRLTALGLSVDDVVSYKVTVKPIEEKSVEIQKQIAQLERDNQLAFTAETDFEALTTLPDLRAAYAHVSGEIDRLKEQLSTPQRRYQSYMERLSEWQTKRTAIVGSDEEPKPETLKWLEQRLAYIQQELQSNLQQRFESRSRVVRQIFDSKSNVLAFYADLKESVDERLSSVRAEGFEIEIDASFVVDRDFERNFLHHINQRRKGPFRDNQDAHHFISRAIRETDWNDYDSVMAFCQRIIGAMQSHGGEQLAVADQAINVKELYDYLFSLDYLSARYELRLGGKNLNELSPGEKGLLLLIFYLQLDRNDTPLVIDQPEDNLDNDSIFAVLAKCIRDAKKHRQVILVTHNPNLAVGADAEQIIYVKLEKANNYKFSYESGSIENPRLNARIVDVLEGSQPAFVKRRLKYEIR